jgi:acyl-CoA thioester hydrolase
MPMFEATCQYRVLYADTDQMGFMYYGQYAKLFEMGRVEAIRSLGLSYKSIEDQGLWMPVYDLYSRYLEPARYDDLLSIKTSIREMPKARIVFYSDIYNQNQVLIHSAKVTLVFIRSSDQKIQLCPAAITDRLKDFFNE